MIPLPFAALVRAEGLSFGLSDEQLTRILEETVARASCIERLAEQGPAGLGLLPAHLLQLRRLARRYGRLQADAARVTGCATEPVRDRLALRAVRWAMRIAPDDSGRRQHLCVAFSAIAATTLKRGSLRMHLVRPQDPQSAEFADLGEHSESCADVPPHRWFKASRALADGLLAVELRIPEGETAKALAGLASADLIAELERSVSRPVLDAIAERAEDRVIAAAAESLLQLLARPPLSGPVAGVVIDKNRIRVCVRLAAGEIEEREFGRSDVRSLVDWLKGLSVEAVGLARLSGSKDASGLLAALGQAGLPNEPVSQAGLMRQAREQSGDIKAAAAAVVAHRLQDPLAGTAGLAPDQLGLGEYLDRVDADLLKAALQDARDAATWLRDQGSGSTAPLVASAGRTLVRDLSEVRPGMELSGTVVNLTHFGAFVELGFPVQGLIHLSEFSERFVDHPSEVVRLGQQVRVKVLSYDAQRGRLSLTLRPNRPNRAKARDQRSAALGELDRLFRK